MDMEIASTFQPCYCHFRTSLIIEHKGLSKEVEFSFCLILYTVADVSIA